MAWHVYIAECKDGSLYTGIAIDPRARIEEHNRGKGSKYIRSRGTARVVYTEVRRFRSTASRREAEIKSWDRPKKLALIRRKPGIIKG